MKTITKLLHWVLCIAFGALGSVGIFALVLGGSGLENMSIHQKCWFIFSVGICAAIWHSIILPLDSED